MGDGELDSLLTLVQGWVSRQAAGFGMLWILVDCAVQDAVELRGERRAVL